MREKEEEEEEEERELRSITVFVGRRHSRRER